MLMKRIKMNSSLLLRMLHSRRQVISSGKRSNAENWQQLSCGIQMQQRIWLGLSCTSCIIVRSLLLTLTITCSSFLQIWVYLWLILRNLHFTHSNQLQTLPQRQWFHGHQCANAGCCCRQSPDDDDACECRVSSGILPTPAVASINNLAVVWCR